MTDQEIDGTVTIVEQPIAPALPPATLFRTDDPAEVVTAATKVADALAPIIAKQHLYVQIRDRQHVRVEGWTLLGSMLGVFPIAVSSRQLPEGGGYECRVEARTLQGHVVGAAIASCTRDEQRWSGADDYALQSMAQTRATSKALRLPLGFVMALAGYDATPAEEMDGVGNAKRTGIDTAGEDLENPISDDIRRLFLQAREEHIILRDFEHVTGMTQLTTDTVAARMAAWVAQEMTATDRHPDTVKDQVWADLIAQRDARLTAQNALADAPETAS